MALIYFQYDKEKERRHSLEENLVRLEKKILFLQAQIFQDKKEEERLKNTLASLDKNWPKVTEKLETCILSLRNQVPHTSTMKVGTSVILDAWGHSLTNYHLVSGLDPYVIEGELYEGTKVICRLLAFDRATDLALLEIQNFPSIGENIFYPLWATESVKKGEEVLLLGNPGGLQNSLALGSIANGSRYLDIFDSKTDFVNIGYFTNWIQVDASMNRGFSGGPLFNKKGKIVGICTSKIQDMAGIGFALPALYVQKVVEELKVHKTVRRSTFGLNWKHVPKFLSSKGAEVHFVLPHSAAQKANLLPGDIVYKVGQVDLFCSHQNNLPKVRKWESEQPLGFPQKIYFQRGGIDKVTEIIPESRRPFHDHLVYFYELGFWGIPTDPSLENYLGRKISPGIWICAIGQASSLPRYGVMVGDILVSIEGKKTSSTREFLYTYKKHRGNQVNLTIEKGRFQTGNKAIIKKIQLRLSK